VILSNLCQEFGCLPGPGSLLEQDPVDIYSIMEARAGQRMKTLLEMDGGPDPSPGLQDFWNALLETMDDDEIPAGDG
jgi:hypothetical protein